MGVKMGDYIKYILGIEKIKKEADVLMMKKIEQYEKEIAIVKEQAQIDILTLEKHNAELKDRVNAAETETALIKATGMNSPEMIAVKKEVCELRQDNRKLAKQVEDSVDRMRKAGLI